MDFFTGSGPNIKKPAQFSLVLYASLEFYIAEHIPRAEYNFAFPTAVTEVSKAIRVI